VLRGGGPPSPATSWPSHDIVMNNIVSRIAYKPEVGGESFTVQYACTSIAPGRAVQVGGGDERMVDSCTTASKENECLVKAKRHQVLTPPPRYSVRCVGAPSAEFPSVAKTSSGDAHAHKFIHICIAHTFTHM